MDVGAYKSKPYAFLEICEINYLESLQNKISGLMDELWYETNRYVIGSPVLRDTQTIIILNAGDKNSILFGKNIFNKYIYNLLQPELESIFADIEKVYSGGDPKRVVLARLPPGNRVYPHIDQHYHLLHSRRIHLPIFTNDNVEFMVDNVRVPMKEGKLIEFNNNKIHSVNNNSKDNRVHLIVDWYKKDDPFYLSSNYKNLIN